MCVRAQQTHKQIVQIIHLMYRVFQNHRSTLIVDATMTLERDVQRQTGNIYNYGWKPEEVLKKCRWIMRVCCRIKEVMLSRSNLILASAFV